MGITQQRLADMLDSKRGKVAGYFYKTQARPEFHRGIGELFQLNMGKFLTIEMKDDNYYSFFTNLDQKTDQVAENEGLYMTKSNLIDVLLMIKKTDDKEEIDTLLDEAIQIYGKVLDENSQLKDVNGSLKDKLLKLNKKMI